MICPHCKKEVFISLEKKESNLASPGYSGQVTASKSGPEPPQWRSFDIPKFKFRTFTIKIFR